MKTSDFDFQAVQRWTEAVRLAQDVNKNCLDEITESYLVFMIMRFSHVFKDSACLNEMAANISFPDRPEYKGTRLRDIGDYCLLICSFFPKIEKVNSKDAGFYVELGRSAYWQLASKNPDKYGTMFVSLSDNFVSLVDVLQTVIENEGVGSQSAIDHFDLWLETGSQRAYSELQKYTSGYPVFLTSDSNTIHYH